jgi:dihydrofolate synthase / folylpolyglutamate synthase
MNYAQAIKFIDSHQIKFTKFNTLKTKQLLKLTGIKLNSIIIHVAGSNGKGSTCAMIESILNQEGFKTGFYSSPHLIELTERIRINKKQISKKEFTKNLNELIPVIKSMKSKPSYFEILTVLTAKIFSQKKLDFIILETGLGGRLDATNAFKSQIQIITDISLEHQKSLGNTLNKIALEKAGIIKAGFFLEKKSTGAKKSNFAKAKLKTHNCFVVVRKDNAGYKVIKKKINEKKAIELNPEKELKKLNSKKAIELNSEKELKKLNSKKEFEKMKSNLLGLHQKKNISLAVTAINAVKKLGFKVSNKSIKKGLMKVKWNARMQVIQKNPLMILDSAHNSAGVKALMNSVQELIKEKKFNKLICVFGVLKDKNFKEMISLISADLIILTKPETHRALNPKKLISLIKKNSKINEFQVIESNSKALLKAIKTAGKKDLILIFGSIYLTGKILKLNLKRHFLNYKKI